MKDWVAGVGAGGAAENGPRTREGRHGSDRYGIGMFGTVGTLMPP
jgi:hypothetical protein